MSHSKFLLMAALAVSASGFAQTADIDGGPVPTATQLHKNSPTGTDDEIDSISRVQANIVQRGVPSQAVTQNLLDQASSEHRKYPSRFNASSNAPFWKNLGPSEDKFIQNGPFNLHVVDTGRLQRILPDPQDPNSVFVLSSGGGLWVCHNFTSSNPQWQPLSDQIGNTSGGAVAFGNKNNSLYLGLGDPFDAPGGAILKSTNNGNTWSSPVYLTGNSAHGPVRATRVLELVVDQANGQDIILVGTDFGLFRSTDSGATFNLVSLPGTAGDSQVWSMAKTNAGWLASVQTTNPPGTIGGSGPSSIYLSTDNGATWTQQPGLSAGTGRTTLAVGAKGDKVVYAFAANTGGTDQFDLFRSADGGKTFLPLNINSKVPTNPTPSQHNMDLMNGQAWYNQMVQVDASDATRNTVYIGGNLASGKSTDGGNTWAITSDWLARGADYVHADFHTSAQSTLGGKNTIFVGTDGGLFFTQDGGAHWNSLQQKGIVDQLLYAASGSQNNPGQTLIGLQDDGTRSHVANAGGTYNQVLGGDGFGTAWSQANDAVALGSIYYGEIYGCYSTPPVDESCFQYAGNTLDFGWNFHTSLYYPSAKSDPTGQVFLTTGQYGLDYTSDGGRNWTLFAIADNPTYGYVGNIHAGGSFFRDTARNISADPSFNRIGAVMTGGKVGFTLDGGNTWQVRSLNAEVPGFASFTSNVTFAGQTDIYVTSINTSGNVVHVVKSSQNGAKGTWTRADNGLPSVAVARLLADESDPTGNTLYAATDIGVYVTTDGAQSWSLLGQGLPQVRVEDLYLYTNNGTYLNAASYGRGLWSYKLK